MTQKLVIDFAFFAWNLAREMDTLANDMFEANLGDLPAAIDAGVLVLIAEEQWRIVEDILVTFECAREASLSGYNSAEARAMREDLGDSREQEYV